ncbi:MAG TPA: cell division protein [Cytophagales bacterium]|nr:cell division protein [Cytophagales bacterium]HAP62405.1 cell division protein [Cytophagales bacterium]
MSNAPTESAPRKKKKLGNFPIWGELFGVTLSLLVVGLYGLLFLISYQAKQEVISNIELQIFLDNFITSGERFRLEQSLATRDYVLADETDDGVRFVSKEEEAQRLIAETGEDFMELLGENPLRDVLIVRVKPSYVDTTSLNTLKTELEAERGIHEVVYMEGIVEQINDNLVRLGIILLILAAIITLAVVMLINNTIKLALFSQRFLIRSMQLVGAKPGFVQSPFLRRSLINGMVSGLLASAILYGMYTYSSQLFPKLEDLKDINQFFVLFALLILLGGILASLSTWRAIRKYLRMSLDDLY